MADFNWIQSIDVTLAGSGVNSSQTTVDVVGFTLPDGTPITTAMLGTAAIGYGTFEPETSREENFSFTGVTDNGSNSYTLTGVTRGLKFVSPYTADATLQLPHSGSTILRLTNSAPFYNEFSVKRNEETITGAKTFVSTAIPVYNTHPTFTQDTEIIDKKYADDLAIAGAPNASTVVQGLVQLPTQAQVDARTAVGSTGASLTPTPANLRTVLTHDYAASVVGTDAYAISPTPAVTAYATGDTYIFKADVANTGAATLNVSGLGAKTILAKNGAALVDREITASSINCVVYDGTNFHLAWTTGDMSLSQSGREIYAATNTGNDTYVVTLSPVPLAYNAGFAVRFKVDVGNTGAATLNVNGLGAVALVRPSGTALETGDITAGNVVTAVYDGTNFQISGLVPSGLTAGISSPLTTLHAHKRVPVTFTYDLSTASGSAAVAHGLGAVPNWVELRSYLTVTNGLLDMRSDGGWNGDGTYSCVFATDTTVSSSTSFVARVYDLSGTDYQTATLTVDATNVTFSWTKTSTPTGTAYFTMWTGV